MLKEALKYPLNSLFAVQSYDDIYGEHRFLLASHAAEGIVEEKYENQLKNPSGKNGFKDRIEFLFKPLLNANKVTA